MALKDLSVLQDAEEDKEDPFFGNDLQNAYREVMKKSMKDVAWKVEKGGIYRGRLNAISGMWSWDKVAMCSCSNCRGYGMGGGWYGGHGHGSGDGHRGGGGYGDVYGSGSGDGYRGFEGGYGGYPGYDGSGSGDYGKFFEEYDFGFGGDYGGRGKRERDYETMSSHNNRKTVNFQPGKLSKLSMSAEILAGSKLKLLTTKDDVKGNMRYVSGLVKIEPNDEMADEDEYYICGDDEWESTNGAAEVVCNNLFSTAYILRNATTKAEKWSKIPNDEKNPDKGPKVVLNHVRCSGGETNITFCKCGPLVCSERWSQGRCLKKRVAAIDCWLQAKPVK